MSTMGRVIKDIKRLNWLRSEIKNVRYEKKNTLGRIDRRLDLSEEKINELEGKLIETIQKKYEENKG